MHNSHTSLGATGRQLPGTLLHWRMGKYASWKHENVCEKALRCSRLWNWWRLPSTTKMKPSRKRRSICRNFGQSTTSYFRALCPQIKGSSTPSALTAVGTSKSAMEAKMMYNVMSIATSKNERKDPDKKRKVSLPAQSKTVWIKNKNK